MTWKEDRIGNVCQVGDGAHGSLRREEAGILYLSSKNFQDGKLDLSKVDYISEETYAKYFRKDSKALTEPQFDDVVVSIIGSIGAPYLIRPLDHFGISSSVAIIRPNQEEILPQYLFYWIKGHIFQDALYGIKGGVAQGYVSLEMIRSLPIHFPSIDTQRKIATILSAYDDLIENNSRRIQILKEMAQAIYREWFVHFRFPGHETVRMVDSGTELGEGPEGWEVGKLGDFIEIQKGKKAKEYIDKEEGDSVPYLLISALREGIYTHTPRDKMKIAEKDDVIMVMDGASSGEVYIGHFGAVGSTLAYYRPLDKEIMSPNFLYHFLQENYKWISDNNIGSAIPHANKVFIRGMGIALPPNHIATKFHGINTTFLGAIENYKNQNRTLRTARDFLLPKLISGDVDVVELDIKLSSSI